MCGGTTPLSQHGFAQAFRITLTAFGNGHDFLCDYIIGYIASINKLKRYECYFVGDTHDPDCFRVELLTV